MSFSKNVIPISIPYEEIESATNNFATENLLAQGSYFKVYKAQLLHSGDMVDIFARISLNDCYTDYELSMSSDLNHKNIVSVFKICVNKGERIIINRHYANGSLSKHLSGPTFLTWMQRLHICVGVTDALKYIHYDAFEDEYIIHNNANSSKVLLDHNWEPKLHGFRSASKVKKNHLDLTNSFYGKLEHKDPAYEKNLGI
ncbi:putative protein kinase RLK-Pelle-CR4L family [Helianthus annuus]|nr:putative protein kinase RLK-Pelle-CR4L family [Helianthus annuus]